MKFGRYEILKEIGKGAMGVVYLAHDPNLDINVALKVLRQDRLGNDAFVRRFVAEAKAMGRLDHPNIARVFNVDSDGSTVYIAMEFIEGECLAEIMRNRKFDPDTIAELGATLSEALDCAHQKGIVHRDVKPSNILFKADGRAKITDFGIAHIEDPSAIEQTQAGEILGTPAYMSPEQVLGRPVDGRSDVFSLGIIMYELATGGRPFTGDGINAIFTAITTEEPSEVYNSHPEVPRSLSDAIKKCLKKDPDKRFASGSELAAALRASCSKKDVVSMAPRSSYNRKVLIAAAGVIVLCTSAFVYYLADYRTQKPAVEVAKLAGLDIESSPAGAQVFIDGALKGMSPAHLELASGNHEIRLSHPDYFEWEAQVELKEQARTPLSIKLIPLDRK